MTFEEARAYIANLTHDEKVMLNDFLKALEQKRQPCQQTGGEIANKDP